MAPPRVAAPHGHDSRGARLPAATRGLLERLAAQIHARRFGDGLEGLALGQGVRLVLAAGLTPGHVTYGEGLVIVADDPDPVARRALLLRVLARVALRNAALPTTARNIARLATQIGRPCPPVARCAPEKPREI